MLLMARYRVPGPSWVCPAVSRATSCMMAYPWRSPSHSASTMWKVAEGRGRGRPTADRLTGTIMRTPHGPDPPSLSITDRVYMDRVQDASLGVKRQFPRAGDRWLRGGRGA